MKYSNTVEYNISTKLDASGLTKLQSQIKQVELSLQRMGDKEFLNSDRVSEARKQLEGLNTSLTKSFNSSLGILDLSKLQTELQNAGVNANGLGTAFNMAGAQGQAALNGLITQIGNFNGGIERTSSQIDKIFTTFSNTFRWGIISSFFSQFMNAIHNSVDYVKELDDSLTQIMLVTDYNRDSMNEYAKSANEAAKALSMSTTGMTNASLIFAQQGYDLNQSQELATLSAKLANASQQDTATTSDQITAYMNAYGLEDSIGELTQAMDNWALIANVSAADVSELAQASQRAASMANTVGVSGEALAAQIATIESVTREAPEQIGNGLKTLYARFSDISLGGEDEDGIGLGKVTSILENIGVKVLDEFGNIRTMDNILEDLMVVWDDLDETSKIAASQALAGKYQVNRFVALMDNSDMYKEYKGATGENATGTLDIMNQEYAESLAGRTQKFQTTLEGLFNDLFTTDMVYPLIDGLTKLADSIDMVFKSIGNGPTILLSLASAFGQLFSTNIARSINDVIANQQLQQVRKNNIANVGSLLDQYGLGDSEMGQYIKNMAANAPKMNEDQYNQYMAALQDWSNTTTQLAAKEEELQGTIDALNMVYGTKLKTPNAVNKNDETGKISFTEAEEARANLSNKQLTALASKEDFTEETQQLMGLSKELGRAQSAYENLKSGMMDTDTALEIFDESANQAINSLIDLNDAGILNDATFENVKETFLQVYHGLTEGTDDIQGLEQELDELIRRFANLGEAAGSMDPNTFKRWLLSGIERAKQLEQERDSLQTQSDRDKTAAEGIFDNIVSQNAIEGIVKATSSLGQLASAITTVQNLGQILTDDSLGPMEKFTQVLTGLGILIPTVVLSIKSLSEGIKALSNAQILSNVALTAHQVLELADIRLKRQLIMENIKNGATMLGEAGAAVQLAEANVALAAAETAAGAGASTLASGLVSVLTTLGPIGIAAVGLAAVIGGIAISGFVQDLQEAQAQEEALAELTQQTSETVSKLNETAPALNELYEAYEKTGEASEEFKQSLQDQAELLGINDAALLISQGKYEELKTKIDEATESIYNNNAALQQAKLDKTNPEAMVNELTEDQKERYGISYHQEEGITGISGGTAEKGFVNKLDQTPYEIVKAAQKDIENQQERINNLTEKRNQLILKGSQAEGEAAIKIASQINGVEAELKEAAQLLSQSQDYVNNHQDILDAGNTIRDNTLDNLVASKNNIFEQGSYENIKDFLKTLDLPGIDSSNIDELIQKYAELAENEEAAAEAALKVRDNQIQKNDGTFVEDPDSAYGIRMKHFGEEGRNALEDFASKEKLSKEEQAKISDMIDWSDPDVDQKVAELLERIQEGLNKGLTLEDALKIPENPEDIMEAFSEMKPIDTDVAEESFQNLGKYINENWEELEELNEALGESAQFLETDTDYLAEVTEAILRYQDALDESTEKMDDWLEALDSENFEDRSNAIAEMTDNMEDLLGLDAGTLGSDFVTAEDNIENFKNAINGVEEAYDQLYHDAIAEEVLHIEADDTQAMAVFDECWAALNEFDGYANTEFELTANDAQAITAMENLLNSLGLVGDAAVEAAKAMGYEIELEPGEVEANDTQEVVGFIPQEVTTPWTASIMPSANPNAGPGAMLAAALNPVTASGVYSGVTYDQQDYSETVTKKTSATGMKVKSGAGASSGGGVKIKSLKRIAPTGGAKQSMSGSKGGGGGGKGGGCFLAGTLITMCGYYQPIEEVKPGQIVLSYNEQLQKNEYSIVLQTMIHDVEEEIYTLYIKDEKLQVTGIHRFFVKRNKLEWVHAENLKVGDWVLFADGTWHLIWKIDVEIQSTLVYNFEVSNNHNYYVGHNRILAHNKGKGGSCFVAGTYVSTSQGFKPIELIRKSDIVLSYNEKTKQNEYSQVLQTMIHNTIEPIYTLYIKDEQLRVTGIHKFLVKSSLFKEPKWIAAEDLKIGNWVLFANNTWHLIWKIDVNLELQTVYNFEVANNHNYYVGRGQILAHNKGKGGGGKGGGGGGKAKTIEDKEKKEHKKDYYEEVNSQLDKTEKVLSRIAKQEDRLIGDKARAKQNKQLDLLQKEIDIQKEKQKIQQQELKDVDELFKKKQKEAQDLALKNQIPSIVPSAMYDEDGIIMNYEQISEALDKIHNQFIDKYNAAAQAGNEDLTKEIDKTLKKFDDYSKEILDNAKRHNKLQSEIEETTNKLEELEDKIEDIRIEAYKAHQEAIDDLKDLKEDAAELNAIFRDYDDNDFFNKWSIDESPYTELLKILNKLDNIFKISKEDAEAFYDSLIDKKKKALLTADEDERKAIESSIAYFEQQKGRLTDEGLTNGLLGLAQQDLEQLKGWWDGTNTEVNPFGENTAALKEAYEDAYKRLKDLQEDYAELIRDQKDETLDLADAAEKGIERQTDAYDRLNDKLEQINDTYQLYYGEDSYENILKIMDQQADTMESELDQLKSAYSYWQIVYQDALAVGDEDFINEIEDKMNDAEEAMLDKAEELADHFVDRYEKAVDAGIQKMTDNLWGGGEGQMDLEDQSTIWELQKDYMDTYKDDVEKAYEVDKLRSKYIGLLNDAQGMSLQTQNKIRAQMQEQLDLLQNQKTVSEYDVKLANAKLEILQKQIALEDAQRNKNKMQLRRDTQGNYRYVYTAEQGDVQQAQDELNESQYDAYEMTKEQTVANNDRAINLYQNYMDRMRDIANKYKDDEDARVAALAALNQEYSKLLGTLEEDFKDTTNGMYDVLTWMVENGTQDTTAAAMDMLDTLYDKNGQVKEDTGVAWRDLATQISEEVLPNIEDEVLETMDVIGDQASILKQKMTGPNGALDIIGSSAEKMTDSLSEAKNVTDELAAATEQLFLALGAPDGALKKAINNLADYSNSLKDVQNSNSQLGQALKDSNTDLQAANAEKLHYKTALDYATGAKSLGKGDKIKLRKGTYVHYSRNNSQSDTTGATGWTLPSDTWVRIGEVDPGQPNPYGFYSIDTNNKDYFPKDSGKTDYGGGEATVTERHHQNWWFTDTELQKNIMEAMDTGGYTGEWHDQTSLYKNGKVAMLHQKELVLNETDTKNILSAVDMLRQMNASVYSGAFSPIRFDNKGNNPFESIIEQRVEIQATFPNATDVDDIRTALLGLSDKAYQYAHRRI